MSGILHRLRLSRQPASLYQRLSLGMVLLVIVTVIVGGLPAVGVIWSQLEQQIWLRVQDAQAATQAFYETERIRLSQLSEVLATRSTLWDLIERRDVPALTSYLDRLQQDTKVDALLVLTPDQQALGPTSVELSSPEAFLADRKLPFADFVVLDNPPRLALVAASEIQAAGEPATPSAGQLVVAQILDNDFMQTLADRTGLAQSLIVNQRRAATSLGQVPDWPLNPDVAMRVVQTRAACCTVGSAGVEEYYVGFTPLFDEQDRVVALSEVALPGNAIRAGAVSTVALLFGIGFFVALGSSIVAIVLTRRITRPLRRLSQAAGRMSTGDLSSPISSDSHLIEIDQLAGQLDRARRHLRQTLQITQREMKHIERLLGSIHEGVVTLDETGRVTFFSPDAERILDYRAADVLQAHYSQVFRPAPGETFTLREILRAPAKEPAAQHLVVLDAHDQLITLTVSASWLSSSDTTSHRECVLELRDMGEEEAVNRLRCNFLANVAHEFRTPLAGIGAATELLVEEGPSLTSSELSELANTIRLSILHLQTLVDNLLESTTLEAGCFRLRSRPIRLLDVIQSVIEMTAPLLKRREQTLEVLAPEATPTLWADPDRLAEVFVNLLANASKFGPNGTPIILSVDLEQDTLMIAVLDSGPGLPTGRFADLFNRFVTGDQPRDAQYGIGLGLSVVKAIVEAHGGQVGAENRVEGGARVWFTLPLRPPGE